MKLSPSKSALFLILLVFALVRYTHRTNPEIEHYNVLAWDALGYYHYLPGVVIHDDLRQLDWLTPLDSTYHLSGGTWYQFIKQDRKPPLCYTAKYLCGVAVLQTPFFLLGHGMAQLVGAPTDGFSWPYQLAIMLGAIFYTLLGLVIMRLVLLHYFDEKTTALTLILISIASNLVQYSGIDAGMSHAWIFPLYAAVLYLTMRWYENPKGMFAFWIGLLCGLAVITRPTEILMIFIPLLWRSDLQQNRQQKWALVNRHKKHILWAVFGGLLALLPQLLYWKYTTGSFLYDVGSKWYFFNPWFRVLFGSEKGWFIYTPVAIGMVVGFGYLKNYPFRWSVLIFCLLQIWVIISWSDWNYGASYSTRALTHCYPVFALSLAAFVYRWRDKTMLLAAVTGLLLLLNAYQIILYNHYLPDRFSPFVIGFFMDF